MKNPFFHKAQIRWFTFFWGHRARMVMQERPQHRKAARRTSVPPSIRVARQHPAVVTSK